MTSENWVDISTCISTRLWTSVGHFAPGLMRTYQKQYGGLFVRHLVYHWVEESWYRELSQICHSARANVLLLTLMCQSKPGLTNLKKAFSKHPCHHGNDRNLTSKMSNLLSLVKVYSVHTKYEPQRVLNDTPIIKLFTTTLINCGFCSKLFHLIFFLYPL